MRTPPLALALVLAGTVSACSGSGDGTAAPTPAPTTAQPTTAAPGTAGGTVHDLRALAGNRWSVGTLTLKAGDSVRVTDADPDVPHNFKVDGVGSSPTLNSGDTYTLKFPTAGTFGFVCTFHQAQGMEGTITVQ